RLDHIFSRKLNAFARYSYAPSSSEIRQPGDNLAELLGGPRLAQTLTGGISLGITPTLIDELRLNLSDSSLKLGYTLGRFGGAAPPPGASLVEAPYSSSVAIAGLFTNWGAVTLGPLEQVEQRQI